jgi:cell division cycle protein 20 (cofactor of APC complex)
MAATAVSTPLKSHHSIFSTRTAGGRMPLTPSPRARTNSIQQPDFTTPTVQAEKPESLFSNNYTPRFSRALSKTAVRDSPKTNIAQVTNSPRRLNTATSDFSLTGTGPAAKTPGRTSKINIRPRPGKTAFKTSYNTVDRFIPSRSASEAIINSGAVKIEHEQKSKNKRTEACSILASGASALNIGGRASHDDVTAAFDGLGLEDEDNVPSYTKPAPDAVAYEESLANACGINRGTRILAFKPAAPESSKPIDLRSQYNRPLKATAASASQFRRRVLTAPERVLDAPGLVDDYYLNLLDWSSGNQVAIGLERNVYVWSAESGTVNSLLECSADTYISSVKWSGDGAYVGVGLGTGEVQIWDVEEGSKLRSMFGHETRVGVMGWNKHLLSTGARSGLVYNHDVRIADHKVAELNNHVGEVCGLEWRADGAQLATGGNDNLVSIWDARSLNAPKFSRTNHRAAVKALSWCPWQPNLLATGGGSHDRHIHFWNTTTGARVNSIDTGSQVTSLRWSTQYKELASTSGFPDNSVSIWSYPTLVKNVEIPAHESRVLHSCLSPDGQMLATAGTLCLYSFFHRNPIADTYHSRR